MSNELPDAGAAGATGPGPHPENHHPKGKSVKLVLKQHSPVANGGERARCYQPPTEETK